MRNLPPLLLALLVTTGILTAAPSASRATLLDADTAAWLEGCWAGEGLGGRVEECWVRAADGWMTAVFQFTLQDRLVFNEIVMLAPFEDGAAMRVKHFDRKFGQWESDQGGFVSFPLVEAGEKHLQFEGLRYELEGDTLTVSLDMKDDAGNPKVETFSMQRK